ncbi:hypothetical protein GCM10027258_80990 [Amycolatopsis stemonae]
MPAPPVASLTIVLDPAPHPLAHRFAVLAATQNGWRGGDSAYAIDLAHGRQRLWLFSDTLLADNRMVNNCIVVEDVAPGGLRTVLGGTAGQPDALVTPIDKVGPDGLARWLWAGHGVVVDDPALPADRHRLWIFYQEYQATVPDEQKTEWDFAWRRTVRVELTLPDLCVLSRTPIADGTGVQWGAAVHRVGDELLVYGVADEGMHKHLLLASTSVLRPAATWLYRTNTGGWSPEPADAARLLTGVSNEVSVLPLPDDAGWLLVTSDTRRPHGSWPIVAYRAQHPAGPWTGPQLILDPPENNAGCYAYNPTLLHQTGNSFLLAYSVNGPWADVLADETLYRPRFHHVQISAVPRPDWD